MTVRDLDHPWALRAAGALNRFNDRHPWSHNDHFHPWILRHLPARRHRAVDIGCGRGELLRRLAGPFDQVHGTDLSPEMRQASAERCAHLPNVTVDGTPLQDLGAGHDLITMVAVLHHLDAREALGAAAAALAPAGRLLVVGLVPAVTPLDQVWDVASMVANPVMGLIKHPRRATAPASAPPFPVRDPETPFDELKLIAGDVLPGVAIRRRLYFRYTVAWTRPG